jgi:hypothetical protein
LPQLASRRNIRRHGGHEPHKDEIRQHFKIKMGDQLFNGVTKSFVRAHSISLHWNNRHCHTTRENNFLKWHNPQQLTFKRDKLVFPSSMSYRWLPDFASKRIHLCRTARDICCIAQFISGRCQWHHMAHPQNRWVLTEHFGGELSQ